MTLAVILPFFSTYSSTGVPSGVLPKSILSRLPWLLETPPIRSPAITGNCGVPSRLTATTNNTTRLLMDRPLMVNNTEDTAALRE